MADVLYSLNNTSKILISFAAAVVFGLSSPLTALAQTCGFCSANDNTAGGALALNHTAASNGAENSAFGADALFSNTTGSENTAIGASALFDNTSGGLNTAVGLNALGFNLTGSNNTAIGLDALFGNRAGNNNTATGVDALLLNTASQNTGDGANALERNTSGTNNTADGFNSLSNNATGDSNSAIGENALATNSTGSFNTAAGTKALLNNTVGNKNTATGFQALVNNTTGQINLGLGYGAGFNLTTGSNNIEIANAGNPADTATIRIGLQGTQTQTFIAGIAGSAVTGSDVVVNATGKLGVVVSSARYKRDIHAMGRSTDALMKLRPVTFIYKDDKLGTKQYGLVAEEVDKVYPELVVHDPDGKVESVRYSMLTSMLLNELQKQQAAIVEQKKINEREMKINQSQAAEIARIEASREKDLIAISERELAIRSAFAVQLAKLQETIDSRNGKVIFQATALK